MRTLISEASDSELVERALGGDQSAVAAIYDRYADAIYSFCRARLRNDADAADVTQDTFVRAASRLGQLRDPEKLRSWLYAIARNQIVSTTRAVTLRLGAEDMDSLVSPEPTVDADLLRVEAADQLWDAAGALQPRDQEVLELHLRHGLVGQGLAGALGVSEDHANVMLSRMRDRMAVALGSLLVARQGRDDCDELDMLLAGWDGRFTLDIRARVNRHVNACEICQRTRGTAVATGLSFGTLPIIPAPALLRAPTIEAMSSAIAAGPTPTGGDLDVWLWDSEGFPTSAVVERGRRGMFLLAAATVALVALIGATIYALSRSDDDVVTEVAGIAEVATTTTTSDVESEPTTTVASSSASTPSSVAAQASSTEPSTTTTSASTTSATTTSTEPPTTTEPPVTEPPVTEPPATTGPPVTEPPVTEPPVTEPPVTEPPVTEPPVTEPPVTEPPVTEPPNEPPVIQLVLVRPDSVEIDQGRCPGRPALVSVEAIDNDGEVESVTASWSADGTDTVTTKLDPFDGGPLYRATIGPWSVEGDRQIDIAVTDDGGETVRSSVSVTVTPCQVLLPPPIISNRA